MPSLFCGFHSKSFEWVDPMATWIERQVLYDLNVLCLPALGALGYVELNALALLK